MVFLFIFIIIVCGLIFSKIKTEIINFKFTSVSSRHINKDYKIIVKLYIFYKIPIFKITLTPNKFKKFSLSQKAKNMAVKAIKRKNEFDKKTLAAIKKINITIKNMKLKISIGTENAATTAIIVGILSAIIAIILEKKIKDNKNQTFDITPIYINQNLINIAVSSIFEVKMIHIINIIYILTKKEGVKKYERTSNRRSYDYGYE